MTDEDYEIVFVLSESLVRRALEFAARGEPVDSIISEILMAANLHDLRDEL